MIRDLETYKDNPNRSNRQKTYTYTELGPTGKNSERLIALDLDEIVSLTATEEKRPSVG